MIASYSSIHGSPGVTSWNLLTAVAWPSTSPVDRVVLEADGDGGVLAARYGLGVDPGIAALLAAARRHDPRTHRLALDDVARRLGERVWVIPGPESAEAAAAVWGSSADDVAAVAARDPRVWLVDCGRLSRGSFARPFVARAELAVVVCGPTQEDLVAVPARVESLLRIGAGAVGVLIVGRPDYGREELRDFFGTGLVWTVRRAKDLASIANLALSSRRVRRTWAWREAVELAGNIADRLATESLSMTLESGLAAGDE